MLGLCLQGAASASVSYHRLLRSGLAVADAAARLIPSSPVLRAGVHASRALLAAGLGSPEDMQAATPAYCERLLLDSGYDRCGEAGGGLLCRPQPVVSRAPS